MLKKSRTLAVAVGTAALMATGASAASATTLSNARGPLANGSVVSGPLASAATLTTSVGNISCSAGSLGATVSGNGAASVGLTSPSFTLGTCTDWIAPFNFTGFSLTSVASSTVTAGSGGGTLNVTTATIKVRLTSGGLPGSCSMVANTVTGVAANADSSVTFTNVPVSSAQGICGQFLPMTLSAKFRPMTSEGSNVTLGL
ncbi:hypothetical protein [Patulibacter sp. SYSU D01012]|uniref:hypothetical protein n=1 Tax=Patulibacter sp. SYSU D01012 TaxID=2817381 RepID=UPI001B30FFB8|nr:hypothetical protein [Patulibacter sp. SYSU D01012]